MQHSPADSLKELDSGQRPAPLGGRGREMEFLSLSKREEGDMKDRAAGEEMKRSERRRETTGV